MSGDERVYFPVLVHGAGGDVRDKDVQYEWFELVNSGHLYRI